MRSLLALAAVVVLAGCGSATVEHAGGSIVPDRPSPPIRAVDEAPPDDVLWFLKQDFQLPAQASATPTGVDTAGNTVAEICFDSSTDPSVGTTTTCPPPTPEQLAKAQQEQERFLHAIKPAPDAQPRVVAKLALAGGGDELFTAWHNADGELCWETDDETPKGGGGGGPTGPCIPRTNASYSPRCDAFCLQSDGGSADGAQTSYELSGTVPAEAAAIRVTTADGQVSTYELDGPVVDGDRRIFMLELGPSDWRTLELVRHGAVYDTETIPKTTVAIEECDAEVGPLPVPSPNSDDRQATLSAYSRKVDACLKTKPGWPPSTAGLDTTTAP